MKDELNEVVQKAYQKMNLAVDEDMKRQLVDVLIQIVKSGDLVRYTRPITQMDEGSMMVSQKLVYIPYQEMTDLKLRIKDLELEIAEF